MRIIKNDKDDQFTYTLNDSDYIVDFKGYKTTNLYKEYEQKIRKQKEEEKINKYTKKSRNEKKCDKIEKNYNNKKTSLEKKLKNDNFSSSSFNNKIENKAILFDIVLKENIQEDKLIKLEENVQKNELIELEELLDTTTNITKITTSKLFSDNTNDSKLETKIENIKKNLYLNNIKSENIQNKCFNVLNKWLNKKYFIKTKNSITKFIDINKFEDKNKKTKEKKLKEFKNSLNKKLNNYDLNSNKIQDLYRYDRYELFHSEIMKIDKNYLISNFEFKHNQIKEFFIIQKIIDKKIKLKLLKHYYFSLKNNYEYLDFKYYIQEEFL